MSAAVGTAPLCCDLYISTCDRRVCRLNFAVLSLASFVLLANCGTIVAAKIAIITTTINTSTKVKPDVRWGALFIAETLFPFSDATDLTIVARGLEETQPLSMEARRLLPGTALSSTLELPRRHGRSDTLKRQG